MKNERLDRIGAFASSFCAIHCALCALLPAVLGALGAGFLLDPTVEWAFTLIAIGFAATALFFGWRRHRSRRVAAFMLVGIAGLLAARLLEGGEHHGHGEAHAAEPHDDDGEHHADAAGEAHDAHADPHHEAGHDDAGHLIGAGVGILAGLLLLTGHLLNLRETRCCVEDDECSSTG